MEVLQWFGKVISKFQLPGTEVPSPGLFIGISLQLL